MNEIRFFNPTPYYKEYLLLNMISKNSHITQRDMSNKLHVSVSMINSYIDDYESKGYIKRRYLTPRSIQYRITKKGIDRRNLLNIGFLKDSQNIYSKAKNNITSFLKSIIKSGFRHILFYGAGEVAEIMLLVINNDRDIELDVKAVIDDDQNKQNHFIGNIRIVSLDDINDIEHDGILISSYSHNNRIYNKLINIGYNTERILRFFDFKI